jgi:hypothetical protein
MKRSAAPEPDTLTRRPAARKACVVLVLLYTNTSGYLKSAARFSNPPAAFGAPLSTRSMIATSIYAGRRTLRAAFWVPPTRVFLVVRLVRLW